MVQKIATQLNLLNRPKSDQDGDDDKDPAKRQKEEKALTAMLDTKL